MEPPDATLAFWIPIAHATPGVFTEDYSGMGQAVARNPDRTANRVVNRAPAGSLVTFYATGLGQTALPETSGTINREATNVLPIQQLRVDIGGIEAECPAVNTAPGLPAGVYELHCRVPEQLEPEEVTGSTSTSARTPQVRFARALRSTDPPGH